MIQNNTFENNWMGAQSGYAIVLDSVDQGGTAPWSQVANVTFQKNVVQNSPNGMNIGSVGNPPGAAASNFNINNNLLYNISGRLFLVNGAYSTTLSNVSITNNTGILNPSSNSAVTFDGVPTTGFVFSNNVVSNGTYGIFGTGLTGHAAIDYFAPGATVTGNVLIGGSPSNFTGYAGNYTPSSVTFVNPSTGNYNLTNPSLYDSGNAGDQSINVVAPPTVSIGNSNLSVTGGGGTVGLGISVTAPAAATATTLTISGLPIYETITDTLDRQIFQGSLITLSEAEVNSGLTLTSNYQGSLHPTATLTIAASDIIQGVSSGSAPQTITVNDPPPAATSMTGTDLLASKLLTFKRTQEAGLIGAENSPQFDANGSVLAALLTDYRGAGSYDWSPASGETHLLSGLNIAAFAELKADSGFRGVDGTSGGAKS